MTGIAIVGCGYAADFYMANLGNHPELSLVGVYDKNTHRLQSFCSHHQTQAFPSLHKLISHSDVEIVLNLTNPAAHFRISLAALESKRHVYSEKPFALTLDQGKHLIQAASSNSVQLASAPCSVLGEAAETTLSAIKKGEI